MRQLTIFLEFELALALFSVTLSSSSIFSSLSYIGDMCECSIKKKFFRPRIVRVDSQTHLSASAFFSVLCVCICSKLFTVITATLLLISMPCSTNHLFKIDLMRRERSSISRLTIVEVLEYCNVWLHGMKCYREHFSRHHQNYPAREYKSYRVTNRWAFGSWLRGM